MRLAIIVLLLAVSSVAAEKVRFFESWEPRPALRLLWLPLRESWWNPQLGFGSPRAAADFKDFARHHSPEAIVPEISADAKLHHSELTEIAYMYLLAQWPRKTVFRLIEPYRHSHDLEIKQLADSFHDDLLEWKAET
jgi:hypothetical protein